MFKLNYPDKKAELTISDNKILDYVQLFPSDIILMSIKDLSNKLGVSQATISRFVRTLGYNNFKELKSHIMTLLQENNTPATKFKTTLENNSTDSFNNILKYQNNCIEKTITMLDEEEIDYIINDLVASKKIYIYGKGASSSLASLLDFRLNRIGLDISVLSPGGSLIFEEIPFIKSDDFVIIFAFLKLPSEAKALLSYCNDFNISTLVITSSLTNEFKEISTYQLHVYRGEPTEYHSMCSAIAVIEALVVKIVAVTKEDATAFLNKIHILKEKYKKDIPR